MPRKKKADLTEIGGEVPTNGGAEAIKLGEPYTASVTIEGACPILFHRWNNEDVAIKSSGGKGSRTKKFDNVENYIWRNEDGELCVPGEYLRQSIIHAAKYKQDPRSPRKSAMDIVKAGIVALTELASLGTKTWDYEDSRRVRIQQASITRTRPAFKKGWRASFDFEVLLPEYIEPQMLHDLLINAGRLIGIADFRPTYGRFMVTKFKVA